MELRLGKHVDRRCCCLLMILLLAILVATVFGCEKENQSYVCPVEIPARPLDPVEDVTFPIGPTILHTTQTSTVIMWETENECMGEVRYGVAGTGLSHTVQSESQGLVHKVRIDGLASDTRYDYQVLACGLSTSVLSFWTAPGSQAPVRFTVWGDSQSYPERARATVLAMAEENPYFNLHAGDVVTDGDNHEQWRDEFLSPLRPLGHRVPTYAAIGNHEANNEDYYAYTGYPFPTSLADHRQFGSNYSFTYGNVFVMVIDTNSPYFLMGLAEIESALTLWIEEQLLSDAARNATWRIAAGHHPGYAESWSPGGCDRYQGSEAVADYLLPLLSEHGFHLYFAGHTHAYERGEAYGLLHIITGGGGGDLDEWCRDLPETQLVDISHHYVLVEAACEAMTLTAIRVEDGSVIDQVTANP